MNKIISLMLLFIFISNSFVVTFNPTSASGVVENSWNTKTSMKYPRYLLGVVAIDDKIYAIGGYTKNEPVGTNERYDPKTDKWVTLASMPTPRGEFAIATHENKIYCIGNGPTEVYDTVTNSWSTKAAMPLTYGARIHAYVVKEQIFVKDAASLYFYAYDPATDVLSDKINLHISTGFVTASYVVDEKIFFAVERRYSSTESAPDGTYEQIVLIYDPTVNSWSEEISRPHIYGYLATGVTTGLYAPQNVYNFNTDGGKC